MSKSARDERRTAQMTAATTRALTVAEPHGSVVEQLPGHLREVLGELRALVAVSDLCRLSAIKRLQDLKAWCLSNRLNWEQLCDEALPKCRRTIDRYLETLETFGDGTYETVIELTTAAERVAARRLLKAGTIRHEGGCIVIGKKKIPNDPGHAHQILEVLREAIAQRDAAEAEADTERKLRKTDQDKAREEAKTLQAALQQAQDELKKWTGAKVPDGIVSEPERQLWASLSTWWQQFHAALIVFAHHRDQEQVSDAALAAFGGLLRAMRDELADTVQQIEADLQLERPTFRRVP